MQLRHDCPRRVCRSACFFASATWRLRTLLSVLLQRAIRVERATYRRASHSAKRSVFRLDGMQFSTDMREPVNFAAGRALLRRAWKQQRASAAKAMDSHPELELSSRSLRHPSGRRGRFGRGLPRDLCISRASD